GRETQLLIKPMSIRSSPIRGQLHNAALTLTALLDRPQNHQTAQSGATRRAGDAYGLNFPTPGTLMRQAGHIADLQGSDHSAIQLYNGQILVWIRFYRCKGIQIGPRQGQTG